MTPVPGQLQVRTFYIDDTGVEQQFVVTFTEAADRLLQHQGAIRTSINAYMAMTGGMLLSVQMEVLGTRPYDSEQTQPIRMGQVLKFKRRLDLEL